MQKLYQKNYLSRSVVCTLVSIFMAGSIKSALLVWFQYEILNEIISANNKGFIKKNYTKN